MSRMRTCLSDLDLSRTSDSESEGSQENLSCTPLERQDRKQSLLDVRRHDYDDVNVVSRPRAKTTLGNYNVSAYLNSKKVNLYMQTLMFFRLSPHKDSSLSSVKMSNEKMNVIAMGLQETCAPKTEIR